MRLTPPSFIVFLLSFLIAGATIADKYFGVPIPILGTEIKHFISMTIAYIMVALGVLIKGI